jgi:hypothetical protein
MVTLTQYLLYPAANFADLSKCFYEGGFCLHRFNVSLDTELSSQLISIASAEELCRDERKGTLWVTTAASMFAGGRETVTQRKGRVLEWNHCKHGAVVQRPKPAQHRKTLPQQTPAEDKRELTPTSVGPPRPSMRISVNEKGELTTSSAGSRKIEKTFLGSNTECEAVPEDGTSLAMFALRKWLGRWCRRRANAGPLRR